MGFVVGFYSKFHEFVMFFMEFMCYLLVFSGEVYNKTQ